MKEKWNGMFTKLCLYERRHHQNYRQDVQRREADEHRESTRVERTCRHGGNCERTIGAWWQIHSVLNNLTTVNGVVVLVMYCIMVIDDQLYIITTVGSRKPESKCKIL